MFAPAAPQLPTPKVVAPWLALVALTVTTWAEGGQTGHLTIALLLLLTTVVKASLVMGCYMEIADGPRWLVALSSGWLVGVTTMIAAVAIV